MQALNILLFGLVINENQQIIYLLLSLHPPKFLQLT